MKSRHKYISVSCLLALGLTLNFSSLFSQQTAGELFEKALYVEEAQGDLEKAIGLYQQILKKFSETREVCAKAQLQIGLCYEKLGNAEAIKAYEKVLKDFADRPDEVAVARARLAALKQGAPPSLSLVNLPLGTADLDSNCVSPDGTKILGISHDKGDNIAVLDISSGRMELITHFSWHEESFWADCPIYSPDGKEIAYDQNPNKPGSKRYELRVTDLNGKSRLLWSTDEGEVWPYQWLRDGGAILTIRRKKDKSFCLGLVPASGGSFRTICQLDTGPVGPHAAASPDGRYVVFTEGTPNSRNLRIMSIDGQSSRLLSDHPAEDIEPFWSPDGNYIVFKSNRQGGNALWGVAVKDGQPAGEPFLIQEMYPNTWMLSWTSHGLWILKTLDINDIFIQPIDPNINEPIGKPRLLSYEPSGNNSCLHWSPDGEFVAFVSSQYRPLQVRIVVQPSEGGKAREFLAPIYLWDPYMHALAWTPDGRGLGLATLAYNSDNRQATIFYLDLATGEWKTYLVPDIPFSPVYIEWSRDARSLYYTNHWALTDTGIIERNLETGSERYIYRPAEGKVSEFFWLRRSPDYKWLAIQEGEGPGPKSAGLNHVVALELETGRTRMLYAETDIGEPAWSPDGNYLLVIGCGENSSKSMDIGKELGIIPVAGGPLKKLKIDMAWPKGAGFAHRFVSPDWSPDGKQIAFTARSTKGEVYLMKNVIPKDRR